MQAQMIEDYSFEDNFILQKDYTIPEITKENQVLVQMKAASINQADNHLKSGNVKMLIKLHFPCILGKDGSGIVIKVGSKVTQFKIGDEVCGSLSGSNSGTFAQYCVFEEENLVMKPSLMSFSQAAAFPLVGGTIIEGFKCHPKIEQVIKRNIQEIDKSGHLLEPFENDQLEDLKVLIIGASGGTGSTAVLFACHFLSRYFNVKIYAVCSERNVELVKSLGKDNNLIVIDYLKTSAKGGSQQTHKKSEFSDLPSICQLIRNEYGEEFIDFILDTVGGCYYYNDVCKNLNNCKGDDVIFASIVPPGPEVITVKSIIGMSYKMTVNGVKSFLPTFPKYSLVFGKEQKALNLLMNHVLTIDNAFERIPLTQFSLSDLNEGFKLIASKRTAGKIVIDIPDIVK
ncbi:hypothetical protein ABK040_006201 [Willaertia magna]